MKIDYRIGDMFKGGHEYVAHGCNAQGVMGSGVAAIVKREYPYAFVAYQNSFKVHGLQLGQVVVAHSLSKGLPTVFNCITQNKYGTDQRYANYGAIQKCIQEVNIYMANECGLIAEPEVAFPLIGAGLAGGDWSIIAGIIESNSVYFQPVVYDFTP